MMKIAVIGSINMDLTCQADRHPQKGETVSARNLCYLPGGKGANQAVAAARLGADVTMFGCVGDDVFGDQLIKNLRCNGIHTEYIRRIPDMSSGIAMITVADKDNAIVVIPGANGCVTPEYLSAVQHQVLEADILILQNEIPSETVKAAIDLAYSFGKTMIYNPAPAMPMEHSVLQKVNYLTPNQHEVSLLFPEEPDLEMLLELQQEKLIVTLGAEGVAVWSEGKLLKIPSREANVVDTTGAGDTFNGALGFALANSYDLVKALRFANKAAGISTENYGAQAGMPTLDMVEKEFCE